MRQNRYSDQTFADAVNAEMKRLGLPNTVTASGVGKWRSGASMPRRHPLLAIGNVTDGVVTSESFVQEAV